MTMTLERLEELAALARPIDEADYATERQVKAENAFLDACREVDPEEFDTESDSEFAEFTVGATVDEMVDKAMEILRKRLGSGPRPR